MSDDLDAFLDTLGPAGPSAEDMDPVWTRLAAGELSPAELAQLEHLAETDPEIARRLLLFRPLDRSTVEAGTARIHEMFSPRDPRPTRRWPAITATLAMAAVALFFVGAPATPQPHWQVEHIQAASAKRRPSDRVVFAPGSRIDLVIAGPGDAVQAMMWLDQDGLHAIEAEVQVDDGRMRLVGTMPPTADPTRPADLVIVPLSRGWTSDRAATSESAIRRPIAW